MDSRENQDKFRTTDGSYTERSKLTNQDFRNIVLTARSSRIQDPKQIIIGDQTKKLKFKKPYLHKIKERPNKEKTEEIIDPKYRDRAKERRQGLQKDELDLKQLSNQSMNSISKLAIGELPTSIDDNASKYLGGDMKHTHLVKGLDYALLKKVVRFNILIQVKLDNVEESESTLDSHQDKIISQETVQSEDIKFNSILGIKSASYKFQICEFFMFEPGRMVYVYNLDQQFTESFIPTSLVKSKFQVSLLDKKALASTSDTLIQKLINILSYIRQGKKVPTKIISSKPPSSKSKPIDDISIYDDNIGEYNPQESLEQYKSNKSSYKQGSYFETVFFYLCLYLEKQPPRLINDRLCLEPETILDKVSPFKQLAHVASTKLDKTKIIENKLDALTASTSVDSYLECYPQFFYYPYIIRVDDNMNSVIDSDDEVDLSKTESILKKPLINQWDFATEEEYNKYLETKKNVAKGIRRNRAKPSSLPKKNKKQIISKEKAKLDKEWKKISQ
ncbi:hypothetical protein HZS_6453, partial [Henneguya salminicola]